MSKNCISRVYLCAMGKEGLRGAWLAAVLHGLNDGYGNFLSTLMPLVKESFGLSLGMVGLLGSVRMVAASFGQPIAGNVADRFGYRAFFIFGPALTCAVMSFLFRFPGFWALGAALFLAGLGTAAFHPAGAALAGSGGGSRGTAMSIFIAGGTVGAALGPLFVGWFVERYGVGHLEWLFIPAVAVLAISFSLTRPTASKPPEARLFSLPREKLWVLGLLWGIAMMRALVGISYRTFLTVLLRERGLSVAMGGAALALFSLSGALGGIAGGRLSDRVGRRYVIGSSLLAAIPFLFSFLYSDGTLSLVTLALAGFFLMASNPVSIAYAQDLFPGHQGTVSGILLGLSWGLGALMAPLVGHLGDLLGLTNALSIVTAAILPAAAAAFFLPRGDRPIPSRSAPSAQEPAP